MHLTKLPIWLAALALCAGAASCARAEPMPPGATMLAVPETGGVLHASRALALADGGVIVGGQVQYPGEMRVGHRVQYEDPRDAIRNDGIAMRLDAEGEVLWTLRLGDPQAANGLGPIGLLPDGRLLLGFSTTDGTFGDQYFIAGLDGIVEETLPWRGFAEHFIPRSMTFMPSAGYLGGDSTAVDDFYEMRYRQADGYHTHDRILTLLDFDQSILWQRDMTGYGQGIGNYYAFDISDGIMLLGDESTSEAEACTSVIKLDKRTGEVLWQVTDAPRDSRGGMFGASSLTEAQDGSLLFTGAYLVEGMAFAGDERLATLTKLSPDGEALWTKRYDALGAQGLYQITPLDGGYVMMAWISWDTYALLYVDADGELLGRIDLTEDDAHRPGRPRLSPAPGGKVYLVSALLARRDDPGIGGETVGSYIKLLSAEDFLP